MAGTFPTLSTGQVCFYPAERSLQAPVKVHRFVNDSQQRYISAPLMNVWSLQYRRISAADMETLKSFFETQKGAYDKTWVFPFDGTNYTAMAFDQDDFTFVEEAAAIGRYSITLRMRQVKKSGTYASGLTATFPAIATGIVTQLPFSTSVRFKTLRNDLAAGQRYSYVARSSPLRAWTLEFPAITVGELGTLFDFFAAMYGGLRQFSFTDPRDGVTYSKCVFASQQMDIRYLSAAACATRLDIEEFA